MSVQQFFEFLIRHLALYRILVLYNIVQLNFIEICFKPYFQANYTTIIFTFSSIIYSIQSEKGGQLFFNSLPFFLVVIDSHGSRCCQLHVRSFE